MLECQTSLRQFFGKSILVHGFEKTESQSIVNSVKAAEYYP